MRPQNMKKALVTLLALVAGVLVLMPVLLAVRISLTPPDSLFSAGHGSLRTLYTDNYRQVLKTVPLLRFIGNSLGVAAAITAGQLVTSSLAAYAFVYFRFPGRRVLFMAVLATSMIPGEATILSNYLTVASFRMTDTFAALILPFTASAVGIFLVRQFYLGVPGELREAAGMDGCGHFRFLISILVPVSRPVLGALGVYAFVGAWNQYMWPLLVTSRDTMRTVQVGMGMLQSAEINAYGMVMAGSVLVLIPSLLIFILGQKQLVDGMTSGAVKG